MRPPSDGYQARIVKWVEPVNVKLFGTVGKPFLEWMSAKLPEVESTIRSPVRMDDTSPANMTFLVGPNIFENVKDKWRPAALTLMLKNEQLLGYVGQIDYRVVLDR